ncbi:SUMF1/EgtB/PvdO family nonheme iron enzyme [Candidatus Fermentibacteria bacterium]|nr:SUMF1/EgtB/PvdO family nonheme iron enzyme [Candidatus Fermentibacteria bacterium]
MNSRADSSLVLAIELAVCCIALAALLVPEWDVALVKVETVPSGAEIRLSNGLVFTSPAEIPVLSGGTDITVSLDGYASADTTVTLGDSGVVVTLGYVFEVEVTSAPSGALVLADGEIAGTTPVTLRFDRPGRHVLEVLSDDSLSMRDTVVLASNRPRSVHFDFPLRTPQGLVFIPPGIHDFASGSDDRSLRREVALDGYYLATCEVTNSMFCAFLNCADSMIPHDSSGIGPRTELLDSLFRCDYPIEIEVLPEGFAVREGLEQYPVRGVSWEACVAFCNWLSSAEGCSFAYRLPTEAEWERAATVGDGRRWPWGDSEPSGNLLNCSDRNEALACREPLLDDGYAETAPVGSFPPNPWGLYDMSGNVWGWCADWAGGAGSPAGDGDTVKCLRGGSWLSSAGDCSCFSRFGASSSLGYPFAGFRVAADRLPDSGSASSNPGDAGSPMPAVTAVPGARFVPSGSLRDGQGR